MSSHPRPITCKLHVTRLDKMVPSSHLGLRWLRTCAFHAEDRQIYGVSWWANLYILGKKIEADQIPASLYKLLFLETDK